MKKLNRRQKSRALAIDLLADKGVWVQQYSPRQELVRQLHQHGLSHSPTISLTDWYHRHMAKLHFGEAAKAQRPPKPPRAKAPRSPGVPPRPNRGPIDPFDPGFLSSWEWTTLRYQTLKKYGRRCMCCGATPDDGVKIHVDHVKPRRHYPELALDPGNLQVLCEDCNKGKGAWDETDFRREA